MNKIPKIIHLTAKYKSNTNIIQINYLKKINPEFEVHFYNDELCKKFLLENYNKKFVDCFLNIKLGEHKADFFRYCILYKYGGYYIDTDNWPVIKLDKLINNDCDLISTLCKMNSFPDNDKYNQNHIHNGFIACKPELIIMKDLIEYIITLIHIKHIGY
jgi:mannosyltransferase OCH1-like enzyme